MSNEKEAEEVANRLIELYQEGEFSYGVKVIKVMQQWYHQHLWEQELRARTE